MRKSFLTIALVTIVFIASTSHNALASTINVTNLNELEDVLLEQMNNYNNSFEIIYNGKIDATKEVEKLIIDSINIDPYINSNIKKINWDMTIGSKKSNIKINIDYIITANQRIEADKKIKNILSQVIKPFMNDHEKVKAIHDYIILNGKYDKSMQYYSDFDLLTKGTSVCNGYALLTYNMLKELNIPVKLVTGTGNNEDHIWNMVKLDNYWFHLDTTWNDPVPDNNMISYDYYMLTDKQILKDHTIDKSLVLPQANKSYYSYLKELSYNQLLMETGLDIYDDVNTAKTEQELSTILEYKIKHRPKKISVRINKSLAQDSINNAMSKLLVVNYVSEISYGQLLSDSSDEYNILNLFIKYKDTCDDVVIDISNKIFNTSSKINFNAYAIINNKKVNINDSVLIYPYDRQSLNINNGVITFKKAGSYNVKFEYQGIQKTINITALDANAFSYITDKKPNNPVNVKVYDQYIDFSSINQWPFIEDGRTMVPLRAVFEVMNCNVKWDQDKSQAIVEYKDTTVIIPANSTTAYINNSANKLDVPARIVNNRIMVPLRFISEAIQKTVVWDDIEKTVLIY